jgi:hypothetical protein
MQTMNVLTGTSKASSRLETFLKLKYDTMKINWGTAIVIAFVLFMTFILYFVYKIQTNSAYDHELVETDYYHQEQMINSNMEKTANATALSQPIAINKTEEGIMIKFPEEINGASIKGKVFLYRPSDQTLDFELPISINDSNLLIPSQRLTGGLWNITLDFEVDGKNYFYRLRTKD